MHSYFELPDGALLAYEILGQEHANLRPPLALVSGMGGLRSDWMRLASALSCNRTVLIYDHRGNGDSKFATAHGDKITVASLAEDLQSLLAYLRWEKVAILGYSMGGVVAQHLCSLHYGPDRTHVDPTYKITHIVLAATTASPKVFASGQYGLVYPSTPLAGLPVEERKDIVRSVTEKFFDTAWLADPSNTRRFDEILAHNATSPRSTKATKRQSRAITLFSLSDLHAHLPPPPHGPAVLVIHGKKDAIVPFSAGLDLLTLIPHARMVEAGLESGKVDHMDFGHSWDEYFSVERWADVLNLFLDAGKGGEGIVLGKSRL